MKSYATANKKTNIFPSFLSVWLIYLRWKKAICCCCIIGDEYFVIEIDEMDTIQVAKECTTLTELLDRITLPQSDLDIILKGTVGQSSNQFWHTVSRGRITASNFYRVHAKVESLKKIQPFNSHHSLSRWSILPVRVIYPKYLKGSLQKKQSSVLS